MVSKHTLILTDYSGSNNKRLLHDIFHIGPGFGTRPPYQARQQSWRADMGRWLIPGTIWKNSCHDLFITYFTLTFSKHWLLYCKKDLWTDKLRKLCSTMSICTMTLETVCKIYPRRWHLNRNSYSTRRIHFS